MHFLSEATKYTFQFQLLGLRVYLSFNIYTYMLKTKNSVPLHEACTSETCSRMLICDGTAKFRKKNHLRHLHRSAIDTQVNVP
jgi:hypothetical protein